MNIKQIHNLAHLSGSVYRIVYTSMMLYYLMRRKANEPIVHRPDTRRYH